MTDLAAIAARHVEWVNGAGYHHRYCIRCGPTQTWPCDAAVLAALLTPERHAAAEAVMAAWVAQGAQEGYRLPWRPSDLAYIAVDAILAALTSKDVTP